ncbi:MAG: gliding motility-associated C-terminal domain-containing protein [Bacteroidia bacterium]|nr:gliding motility-associated C-terminal domain-containing protein [Bacteroidia bacterium]
MESKNKNLESLIKDKLESYEMNYNHSGWVRLEKDLPAGNSGFSGNMSGSLVKIVAIVGISLVAIVSTLYILKNSDKTEKSAHNQIVNNKNIVVDNNTQPQTIISDKKENKGNTHVTNYNSKVETQNNSQVSNLQPVVNDMNTQSQKNQQQVQVKENKQAKDNNAVDIKDKNNITIIPGCTGITPVPDATFAVDVDGGCTPLKVCFTPNLKCDTVLYIWNFGDGETSAQMSPVHIYDEDGTVNPTLTVKYTKAKLSGNYTLNQAILIKQSPKVDFSYEVNDNTYTFINKSLNAATVKWQFGNGEESGDESPKLMYNKNGKYTVTLIATAANNCTDMVNKDVRVNIKHKINFPDAIVPNDVRNGLFGPIGDNLSDYRFSMAIYNRNGKLVFETKDINEKWNGKIKGTDQMVEPGVYAYEAVITDKYGNTEKKVGSIYVK